MQTPLSYLFVIVKKSELSSLRENIIQEIQGMSKVKINGRRYFNGFEPQIGGTKKPEYCYSHFPDYHPYSISVWAKKGK